MFLKKYFTLELTQSENREFFFPEGSRNDKGKDQAKEKVSYVRSDTFEKYITIADSKNGKKVAVVKCLEKISTVIFTYSLLSLVFPVMPHCLKCSPLSLGCTYKWILNIIPLGGHRRGFCSVCIHFVLYSTSQFWNNGKTQLITEDEVIQSLSHSCTNIFHYF